MDDVRIGNTLRVIRIRKHLVVDPQELAGTMDLRARLGREIACQLGWSPTTISTWVIVAESSTDRRRAKRHEGLLRQAFPSVGRAMRHWLNEPSDGISASSLWSDVRSGPHGQTVGQTRRVKVANPEVPKREARSIRHVQGAHKTPTSA